MKRFNCRCGGEIFFDNTECLACHRALGFDSTTLNMVALPLDAGEASDDPATAALRHCRNRLEHGVCNWFVVGTQDYCVACAANYVIPNLKSPRTKRLWHRLERAKRRLIYSLLSLKLPLTGAHNGYDLKFNFLEDKRSDPDANFDHVNTGHDNGIITINVAEADTMARHKMQQQMRERYRTLLGHFRHESGHYYFNYLLQPGDQEFAQLFGDPGADYAAALQRHYENGPPMNWEQSFISEYATSHPWEDWAEMFAHFLHITDTLETLEHYMPLEDNRDWIDKWVDRSVAINEIGHSLGISSPYPFYLNQRTIEKLRFVERRIKDAGRKHADAETNR